VATAWHVVFNSSIVFKARVAPIITGINNYFASTAKTIVMSPYFSSLLFCSDDTVVSLSKLYLVSVWT